MLKNRGFGGTLVMCEYIKKQVLIMPVTHHYCNGSLITVKLLIFIK